jgi:hypothetical protein
MRRECPGLHFVATLRRVAAALAHAAVGNRASTEIAAIANRLMPIRLSKKQEVAAGWTFVRLES